MGIGIMSNNVNHCECLKIEKALLAGQMKIARRFICGIKIGNRNKKVPTGTNEK